MDPRRFDALTKSLSPSSTRRGLLRRLAPLPLAGVLAVLLGGESTRADGSGAITGGGNRHRNRNKPNHHRRDHGNDTCTGKCGPCARCKDGKCKAKPDGRACKGDGVCTNGKCRPTATCPGEGQTCTTDPGTQCCPDIDPNVVCGGYAFLTCQDCTQPPTAAGELCVAPLTATSNQCCGGNEDCFVGVRVVGTQPACFINASCNVSGGSDDPCMSDNDCTGDFTVCIRNELGSDCCVTGSPATTLCAQPCPAP